MLINSLKSLFSLFLLWCWKKRHYIETELKKKITAVLRNEYSEKCSVIGERMREFEKQITLQILDRLWKEHLATMDQLRQGIFLRSYGGKNPRQEYKREAFAQFTDLMNFLQQEVIKILSHIKIRQEDSVDAIDRQREEESARVGMNYQHQSVSALSEDQRGKIGSSGVTRANQAKEKRSPFVRDLPKVGRNDPCPCGSGKKYKHCCGAL